MKNPLAPLTLMLVFSTLPRSEAAVVETFSGTAQIAATGDPLAPTNSQIFDNPGDFERRRFSISFGGGRMVTTLESAGLNYSFATEMATGGNKLGYFGYETFSMEPINLMGGGESVLRLEFSDLVLLQQISFQINVWSETGSDSVQVWLPAGTRSEAFLDIPFSRFEGVDFSQIDKIGISGGRFSSGTSFVLDSIATVPEPSTILAAVLGGVGILRRRR